jgi:hypothetical protein
MTRATYRPGRHFDATHPIANLHPAPELRGSRDPTDLMPRTSLFVDERWFEAYWYSDRPTPAPGLLRRALHAIWTDAAVLGQTVLHLARGHVSPHDLYKAAS